MDNRHPLSKSRIALATLALATLSVATTACAADRNDLITTASTAGTTAYIVGKNVDEDDFAQAQDFADTRAVALRREAAAGGGENLDSLATLLGEQDTAAFGAWMQTHYAELYAPGHDDENLANRIVAMR